MEILITVCFVAAAIAMIFFLMSFPFSLSLVDDLSRWRYTKALAALHGKVGVAIYAYVRRRTSDVHEAQDMTQAFFERLVDKDWIANADPDRGRFRAFLLTVCKRSLINESQKARAKVRGGGCKLLSLDFAAGESKYAAATLTTVAVDSLTPERLFERQWAITLLAHVLEQLRDECLAKGKARQFDHLKEFLSGTKHNQDIAAAANALGTSEGAVKVAAHRLRMRYRELLRSEIAKTVENPGEVEDEIRGLFVALG